MKAIIKESLGPLTLVPGDSVNVTWTYGEKGEENTPVQVRSIEVKLDVVGVNAEIPEDELIARLMTMDALRDEVAFLKSENLRLQYELKKKRSWKFWR